MSSQHESSLPKYDRLITPFSVVHLAGNETKIWKEGLGSADLSKSERYCATNVGPILSGV